jgi:hypothetical protein
LIGVAALGAVIASFLPKTRGLESAGQRH